MGKGQYNAALKKLGLSVPEAGELFGYKRRQGYRFAKVGDDPIPRPVEKFVKLLLAGKITVEDLR
jgi:hypothetical protein